MNAPGENNYGADNSVATGFQLAPEFNVVSPWLGVIR